MKRSIEDQLLNPRPGSACARARDFGIDLTLTLARLRRSPDDRLRDLQRAMIELEAFRSQGRRKAAPPLIQLEEAISLLIEHEVDFVIIGGVAITWHGSSYITYDLDLCYSRSRENLSRIAKAFAPLNPRPRDFPPDLPFVWDERTLQHGTNFTLTTRLGEIDLLAEVTGVGDYESVRAHSVVIDVFGRPCRVLSLAGLITAKRAAGRPKDLMVLPELEALLEISED